MSRVPARRWMAETVLVAAPAVLGWIIATRHGSALDWMALGAGCALLAGLGQAALSRLGFARLARRQAALDLRGRDDLYRLSAVQARQIRAATLVLAAGNALGLVGIALARKGHPVAAAATAAALLTFALLTWPVVPGPDRRRLAVTAFVPAQAFPRLAPFEAARAARLDAEAQAAMVIANRPGEAGRAAREILMLGDHDSAYWPDLAEAGGHGFRARLRSRATLLRSCLGPAGASALLALAIALIGPFPYWPALPGPVAALDYLAGGSGQDETDTPEPSGDQPAGAGQDGAPETGGGGPSSPGQAQGNQGTDGEGQPGGAETGGSRAQGSGQGQAQSDQGTDSGAQPGGAETGDSGAQGTGQGGAQTGQGVEGAEQAGTGAAGTDQAQPQAAAKQGGTDAGDRPAAEGAPGATAAAAQGDPVTAPQGGSDPGAGATEREAVTSADPASAQPGGRPEPSARQGAAPGDAGPGSGPGQPAEPPAGDPSPVPGGPAEGATDPGGSARIATAEPGTPPPGTPEVEGVFVLPDAASVGDDIDIRHETPVLLASPGTLADTIEATPITGAAAPRDPGDLDMPPVRQKLPGWIADLIAPGAGAPDD